MSEQTTGTYCDRQVADEEDIMNAPTDDTGIHIETLQYHGYYLDTCEVEATCPICGRDHWITLDTALLPELEADPYQWALCADHWQEMAQWVCAS